MWSAGGRRSGKEITLASSEFIVSEGTQFLVKTHQRAMVAALLGGVLQ